MPQQFSATKKAVSNRGVPPDGFLAELVEWGKKEEEAVFGMNASLSDVYASVRPDLGPWMSLMHRRAVMLEVLRVLAGFESSWNWQEGVDQNNAASLAHADGAEAGAWQVSFDSTRLDPGLAALARAAGVHDAASFQVVTKQNHPFAMEYIARLLRVTVRANGPVVRKEINRWLSREAVAEFEGLLKGSGPDGR